MSDHDDVSEIVEIDFEVGHSSIIRPELTSHNPPRTHDWKLFLRSADIHGDLSCLIQRCIFHLHPEFSNHKRELRTTPFAIQETGYAGFHLPIDIYFQTKKEPRKFRIEYDLDLHKNVDGHPYRQKETFLQKYRCTFHDPDPEFRQKILAAGGKIVDSGPIASNNTDLDENIRDEEVVVRHSPQQKRPASPVSLASGILHKKVKLEPPTNHLKKKPVQSVVKNESANKTIVKNKKPKLVPHKSSSALDEKTSKNLLAIKESNPTINMTQMIENLSSSKPRPSTKLIKSQSTHDIKSSVPPGVATKKKEIVSSPSKTKPTTNAQNVSKKPINKLPSKTSIKSESTLNLAIKSPVDITIKQEPSSQPTPTIPPSSVSINNLKKIPKKPAPPKVEEKRSHSVIPSSSSSLKRTSTISKDSQKSKPKSDSKKDLSSSSTNNSSQSNERPKKTKMIITSSIPTPPPPPPPPIPVVPTEDNHIQTPMDIDRQNDDDDQLQLSEESNSPPEQVLIQPTTIPINRISYSDQSETNDSDLSLDDEYDEQDLPTSLANDDLRYKLIYIYQRFQLNSIHDLHTFVRFFKRHQLIDLSTLSTTKSTNDMFTYDLFTLSPSHIGELANDLGYSSVHSTK